MNNQNEDKFDIEAIPDELAERPQWICWRAEDRDGKTTKVPVDPTTGSFASTTDDRTWTTLEQALEYVVTGADGIGFVFTATDPLVGVDLDDCRDPETGKPLEPAPSIIDQLDSFTEVSPSGTGYHVLLEGELPDGRNRHGTLEMYDHARFFTVTADHVRGTPMSINERQEALEAVHEEFIVSEVSDGADTVEANPPVTESRQQSLALEDEELLEKARYASNGEKFDRLWRGSTAGYDSQSEAIWRCVVCWRSGRVVTLLESINCSDSRDCFETSGTRSITATVQRTVRRQSSEQSRVRRTSTILEWKRDKHWRRADDGCTGQQPGWTHIDD